MKKLSTIGRVVIIDDQYKEVKPLLTVMGRQNIPYLYFDGKLENLPDKPMKGIRFIFMDIELSKAFAGQSSKTKASGITEVLRKIISAENGPYALIAWTKHKEIVEQVIENCKKKKIHPVIDLDLDKSEFIRSNKDNNDENILTKITNKLKEELAKTGAFQIYVDWENIVNDASKECISRFSSFFPNDEEWSQKTRNLFYRLYKAYVEKEELEVEHERMRCALHLLNKSYLDILEDITVGYESSDNFRLNGEQELSNTIKSELNSLLFIIDYPNRPKSPGSIYEVSDQEDFLNSLKKDFLKSLKKANSKYAEDIRNSKIEFKLCKLIITPECDIAQNRLFRHRIIYGILYKCEVYSESSPPKTSMPIHLFPIGPLMHNKKSYKVILNFQTITSQKPEEISDANRLFAVKRDLLFDIQSKAANHVNRLGNYMLR